MHRFIAWADWGFVNGLVRENTPISEPNWKKRYSVRENISFSGRSFLLRRMWLHFNQFIFPAAKANLLGVFKAWLPVGIWVEEFEDFFFVPVSMSMGITAAASAIPGNGSRCRHPAVNYRCFVHQICTGLIQCYRVKWGHHTQIRNYSLSPDFSAGGIF